MKLNIYLTFDGQCRAAFEFYQRRLGGEIMAMLPFGDSPMCDEVPESVRDKIMHACLVVDGQMLMGSDTTPEHPYEGINGSHIAIHVDSPEEAERLFAALAEDGTVVMPLAETFWALRFGMLVDQFGVPWMINCSKEGS